VAPSKAVNTSGKPKERLPGATNGRNGVTPFRSHYVTPARIKCAQPELVVAERAATMNFDVRVALDVAMNRFGLRRNSDDERGRHGRWGG
jgi:hypothetical protein